MRWTATPARRRTLASALAACIMGLVLRRPDLVLLFAPFVYLACVDRRPPGTMPQLRSVTAREVVREGEDVVVEHVAEGVPGTATVLLVHRAPTSSPASGRPRAWLTRGPGPSRTSGLATRWGRQPLSPLDGYAVTEWGGWSAALRSTTELSLLVLPRRVVVPLRGLPRPSGLGPGPHAAARAGEGTDFFGLRQAMEGESSRPVHWPATLRTGTLVVRQSHHDAAGDFLLILDPEGASDRYVDVVREVTGVCARLIREGANVGLLVLGCGDVRPLPPRHGRRHLLKLEMALAGAVPAPGSPRNDYQHGRIRHLTLAPSTVVIAFHALNDRTTTDLVIRLRAHRHRVTCLDVGEVRAGHSEEDRLALVEHRLERRRLEAAGIPVVSHDSPGSTAVALSRLRTGPGR